MAWRSTIAAIATEHHVANARGRAPDPDKLAYLRRKLRTERAEEYIRGLVAADPPLTPDQRSHLASLLTGAGGGDAAA